ncbi:MAG TPA: hypothetical protein VHY82_05155 [Acetobacteraceae bacterium]|nr:hypothetical protein [Acetobacteraceae bacterium]
MGEDKDRPRAEHGGAVFKARNDLRASDVASDARHEHMADALVEDQFDRDARIRAGQHGGERLLLGDRVLSEDVQVFLKRTELLGHVTSVAVHQRLQRGVR